MALNHHRLELFAKIIKKNLQKEFTTKLSGNLINTIEVHNSPDKIIIEIPARKYNMMQYQLNHVIVPSKWEKGSYASILDTVGSEFYIYNSSGKVYLSKPHNHKGYINKVLNDSLSEWASQQRLIILSKRDINNK